MSVKLLLLFCCLFVQTLAQTPDQRLNRIIADTWAFQLADEPMQALTTGQGQSPDRLYSYSEAAYQKRTAFYRQQLSALRALPATQLSAENRTNATLLAYLLDEEVNAYELKAYLNPLLADGGPTPSFAFAPGLLPFQTVGDYERYIATMRAFPAQMADVVALLREGLRQGITQPRIVLAGYRSTYQAHIVTDPTQSVIL